MPEVSVTGGIIIKRERLHQRLQSVHNSSLAEEIDRSVSLGKSLSVSPAYTFYDSKETGCHYLENAGLIRVYAELRVRRHSTAYVVLETAQGLVKIPGTVDFIRLCDVYDVLCPKVLIGAPGQELDGARLRLIRRKHRQALLIMAASVLCWTQLGGVCLRYATWQSLALMAAATAAQIAVAVLVLRMVQKCEP